MNFVAKVREETKIAETSVRVELILRDKIGFQVCCR